LAQHWRNVLPGRLGWLRDGPSLRRAGDLAGGAFRHGWLGESDCALLQRKGC
jgi:hypothetical protein